MNPLTRSLVILSATMGAGLVAVPAQATFPGSNGRLVFQRPVGGQMDLFTVAPNGSALRRITSTTTSEDKAEWSPDGRHLAFSRSGRSGVPEEIATTDAAGGSLRVLTHFGSTSAAPTWSPDGRIAFFTLRDFPPTAADDPPPPAELYSMTSDGGDLQRLTNDARIQTDAAWSPDGSTIAYSQWQAVPGQAGVFDIGVALMNRDGTNRRPLLAASGKRDVLTQSWSPDGRRIVFELATSHPSGRASGSRQGDIAVINADGTGLRRLTRTSALESEPVWSPDGRQIAFASDRHVKRGADLDRNGSAFEIYTMRADGTHIRRITRNKVPDIHPNWQPLP